MSASPPSPPPAPPAVPPVPPVPPPLPTEEELRELIDALPDAAAVDALTSLAGAPEPAARAAVAAALCAHARPTVLALALQLGRQREPRRGTLAARVLGAFGAFPEAVRALFHLLHQGRAPVKTAAAEALRTAGGQAVVNGCLALLRKGAPAVRDHAVTILGGLRDEGSIAPLLALAADTGNGVVGLAAATALGIIGGQAALDFGLQSAVRQDHQILRERGVAALGAARDPQSIALLFHVVEKDATVSVRQAALGALEATGTDLRAWLLGAARSADAWLRGAAAERLSAHEGQAVDDALFALGADADVSVRGRAYRALERRPAALERLGLAHLSHSEERFRVAAVWALGRAGGAAHAPALAAALRDAAFAVQLAALTALARCDPEAAAARATRLLEHSNWLMRQEAARVLGAVPRPAHVPLLVARLADDDADVRGAAHVALAAHDSDEGAAAFGLGLLDADEDTWRPTARVLGESPLPPGARRLADAGLDVPGVTAATESIAPLLVTPALSNAALRPHALAALDVLRAAKDTDRRRAAAAALAAIDGDEASARLAAMCRDADEDVRVAALRALAARPDPRGWQELLIALADGHRTVRDAAMAIIEHAASFPALARLFEREGEDAWKRHRAALDDVLAWGRRVGHDFLGEPVEVIALREGAGQTRVHARGTRVPVLEVNPEPLFESPEHGADVVRGVILHELGHHAYDFRQPGFKSANGAAQAEGVGPIFDFLIDERLERRLRAHDADWGELLDRANAHIREAPPVTVKLELLAAALESAPDDVESRVRAGDLPGEVRTAADGTRTVEIPGWSVLTLPGLVPPLHAFFFALLVVRTTGLIFDPVVRKALDLVPANLKDLDHAALASLSVKIGQLLGVRDNGKAARRAWQRALRHHGELLGGLERARRRAAAARACQPWHDHGQEAPPGPKQRKIVYARQRTEDRSGPPSRLLNLSAELGFPALEPEADVEVAPDPARHAALAGAVRPHARRLREHFERLGRRRTDEHAMRRGQRLDLARIRQLAIFGRPDVLVYGRDEIAADCYIGLLIDRSGSMAGKEMELAQRFGVMLAEAARGLRGVVGHVNAFDDSHFYRLGDFDKNGIAGLGTGGSNNDAGALLRAAELAHRSRRQNKLLVMISDGSPTECSVAALRRLVQVLNVRHGIVCAQVAVETLAEVAFPHFLDVTAVDEHEAVTRFGRMLQQLTAHWR